MFLCHSRGLSVEESSSQLVSMASTSARKAFLEEARALSLQASFACHNCPPPPTLLEERRANWPWPRVSQSFVDDTVMGIY